MKILFLGPMLGKQARKIPSPAEELAYHLVRENYYCYFSSSHPNRYLRLLDILWTIIRLRHQVDVVSVQVYSGLGFIVVDISSWLAKFLNLRVVMVMHGGAMAEFLERYPSWVLRVLKRADRLVSPSQFLAQSMKPYSLYVTVIPNGMEINHYPFRLRSGQAPRLIWIRAFHPIYQPEMAVKVVHQLIKEFPDISLQMIGPAYGDISLNNTRELITKLNLDGNIDIVGYVPKKDLSKCLQGGDVFLNTTRYESFGISVMEAAACGLPIVTTNVGELSFLWQNGKNAITVEEMDVVGMANAVKQIIMDANLCMQLSAAARDTSKQFDWSVILPQWERLFQEVIEQKHG